MSLQIFLCHSSDDKEPVRRLYRDLRAAGYRPWLDEEDLLPGQDWEYEIVAAIRASDAVLVCLSAASVSKTGFVQKELRFALDVADEQPEGAIFLIPVKLEPCDVPLRLRRWHWVSLFEADGMQKLRRALDARARATGKQAASVAGDHVRGFQAVVPMIPDVDPAGVSIIPTLVRLRYPHPLKCGECGAMNEEKAWYCAICGAELGS